MLHRTSATRALQVGEILQACPARDPGLRGTLAACARVSEAFYDYAIPILWRQMDSLFPFFKILPAFQEAEISSSEDSWMRKQRFVRTLFGIPYYIHIELTSSHRACLHAWRVITLRVDQDHIESFVLHLLSRYSALNRQPLLARLQELRWIQSSITSHDILFVLPLLRVLDVEFDGPESSTIVINSVPQPFLFEALCAQVAANVPHLVGLSLKSDYHAPCYFTLFAACHSLRQIIITSMIMTSQCPHLSALFSLENLNSLTIENISEIGQNTFSKFEGFHTLEALSVEGEAQSIGYIFMAFTPSASPIRALSITISHYAGEVGFDPGEIGNMTGSQVSIWCISPQDLHSTSFPCTSEDDTMSPLHAICSLEMHNLYDISFFDVLGPEHGAVSSNDLCMMVYLTR
ncbi:hypothetical protein DAEQUDRAFT_738850 [Daedalea quercina L-15889]|uniref:F-box domain-containing protein n=1 Tax=Daedalea quercina L-15889 TaxID=1314783 RepID=A0A165PJV1_9APHY|nr:hypothetical protein DAEQUDRAFT_738850 [Daedalea quercina L-15889]